MKNIAFVTDKTSKTRYAQINLDKVAKYTDEELEDLMDVLVAEARKDDEKITLEQLEKQLKKAGKLCRRNFSVSSFILNKSLHSPYLTLNLKK